MGTGKGYRRQCSWAESTSYLEVGDILIYRQINYLAS
jgi:hypothetical protein